MPVVDSNLIKLATDLGRGTVEKYSVSEANEALRQALIDINGSTELGYKQMRDGAHNGLFALIEEVLPNLVIEGLTGDEFFNQFVDKGLIERLEHVVNSEFGHVTYTEAIEILEKNNKNFDFKVYWGCDLQTEHERYLTEEVFKRPVFVTDYPKEIKAFYMKQNPDGKTLCLSRQNPCFTAEKFPRLWKIAAM